MNWRRTRQAMAAALLFAATAAWARSKSAEWQTYRSPDYGFTIEYPSSMTMYPDRPVKAPEHSMFPVCDWTVACFQYNGDAFQSTPIHSAGVSVNVLREETTEAGCNRIDATSQAIRTTRINGTLFHYADTGEAGLGSGRAVTAYRAFHQGVCFEIALVFAQSNVGEQDMEDLGWKQVDPRAMRGIQRDMDKMLHSFAFVGPVADGANWNVYWDSGCGGTFEYPSQVQIEKVVEYSPTAQHSQTLTCEQAFTFHGRIYSIGVLVTLRDERVADKSLVASGYPALEQMSIVAKGDQFTEYSDETRTYIYARGMVFIFSVTDENHNLLQSTGDKVFAHFVKSFRIG